MWYTYLITINDNINLYNTNTYIIVYQILDSIISLIMYYHILYYYVYLLYLILNNTTKKKKSVLGQLKTTLNMLYSGKKSIGN